MMEHRRVRASIEREDDGFLALCPEFDVTSQGDTIEEAQSNLVKALRLFFEMADPWEVAERYQREVFVTQVEIPVG